MDDTTVTIEIVVTRVARGHTIKHASKVQGTAEWASNSPAYLANSLSKKALKMLARDYANVSKTIDSAEELAEE